MNNLSEFLQTLNDDLPAGVIDPDTREGIGVEAFELTLPIEARSGDRGQLQVSVPRGRLSTGFDMPPGRLRVSFMRS